jgi:DNA-binding LacI/PurR family transcriptional regulator
VATLKDIAQQAGVSVSTVSRIINSPNDNFARKETRDRVWAIIADTGYTPNQSARNLRLHTKPSGMQGQQTLTGILGRTRNLDDNPFFASVIRAVEQQALSLGYTLTVCYSVFDIGNPQLIQKIETVKTDGAIIVGRLHAKTYRFFEQHYKHKVYIGRNAIDANWDQRICDGYQATRTAMDHLLDLGHTRIAYLGETVRENRYLAFRNSLEERGVPLDERLIVISSQDGRGGYTGAERLLQCDELPTAVFCASDSAAIAAIRRFSEAGIQIPSELSVIGMDDIELAQYVSPRLTTVHMPTVEMGTVAVRTLVDRVDGLHSIHRKILLPHRLVVRESTAAPATPKAGV